LAVHCFILPLYLQHAPNLPWLTFCMPHVNIYFQDGACSDQKMLRRISYPNTQDGSRVGDTIVLPQSDLRSSEDRPQAF
jgi:hypothetical protein